MDGRHGAAKEKTMSQTQTQTQTQLYGIGQNAPVWLCRKHAASLSMDPRFARLPAEQRRPRLRRHQPPSWLHEDCLVCQEVAIVAARRSRGETVYASVAEAERALVEAGPHARVAGIYVPWQQILRFSPAAGYVIEQLRSDLAAIADPRVPA